LPASKHHRFTEHSKEGREFIKMWNSAYRDGIQIKLAEHFGLSVATVYRIRKQLGLANLHDVKNHPGKRQFIKRVTRLYLKKERSCLQIGKIFKMNEENIRKILRKQRIQLRLPHITNPAYCQTKSHLTPLQLLKEIKRLYVDEKLPASHIAKKLGIDQSTVRTKLKAMNIKIEIRKVIKEKIVVAPNFNIKGIYLGTSEPFSVINYESKIVVHKGRGLENRKKANCQWCKTEFPQYIDQGPRTQLYCNSKCKNKAKDYRRMIRGKRVSPTRLKAMERDLQNAWGNEYQKAKERILSVTPIIKRNHIKVPNGVNAKILV